MLTALLVHTFDFRFQDGCAEKATHVFEKEPGFRDCFTAKAASVQLVFSKRA